MLTNDACLAGAGGPNVDLVCHSILPAGKETICNTVADSRLGSPGCSYWHQRHSSLWRLCRLGKAAGCLWHRRPCSRHKGAPRREQGSPLSCGNRALTRPLWCVNGLLAFLCRCISRTCTRGVSAGPSDSKHLGSSFVADRRRPQGQSAQ